MQQAFWAFLYKMATRGHFVFPTDAKNHKVLVIWDLNGYCEYEFDWCICDKVMACTSVGVRRRRRRRRNQKHNTPEIFKFRGYNNICQNLVNFTDRAPKRYERETVPQIQSIIGECIMVLVLTEHILIEVITIETAACAK